MKKIFLLVFAFVMCKIGYAQYPMTQFIGTDSAIVVSKGAMQSRFVNVVFADTTTANSQRIKQYPGAMIYAAGKLWYRNATATGWVELTSTSTDTNIYNSDGTLTGPRTLNGNNDDLTFDNMAYFSVNANPSGQVRFYQGSNNNILMRGDTTAISRRLSYNTNLGSSFTKHSLIDKNYVDSSFSLNINGTTNYLPKFTSSSAIGNSAMYDSSGFIKLYKDFRGTPQALQNDYFASTINVDGRYGWGLLVQQNDSITTGAQIPLLLRKGLLTNDKPRPNYGTGLGMQLQDDSGAWRASSYFINRITDSTAAGFKTNMQLYLPNGSGFVVPFTAYADSSIRLPKLAGSGTRYVVANSSGDLGIGTDPVTGTGTTNYVSKFNSSSSLANSQIYDNGSFVAIGGTTSPLGNKLEVIDSTSTVSVGIRGGGGNNGLNISDFTSFTAIGTKDIKPLWLYNGDTIRLAISSAGNVDIGNNLSADSSLTVEKGTHLKRGVRMSGLPTGTGTKSLRVDANGTLSIADTLANGISGTGTTNYIPKFTSSSAIGNSIIYDDGASPYQRVGIATTSLDSRFLVKGIDNTSANTTIKAIDNSDNALFYVRNDGNLFVKSNLGLNTASPDLFSRGYAGPILGMTTSSGNVGIEMNSASGSSSFIDMGNGGGRTFSIAANPTSTVFQGVGAFPMIFQTNSSERMRLDASGNLGLGTSSPTYKLNVLASAGTQAIFQAGQTGVSNGYTINSNGTNLTYQWYNGGNEAMRLDASGNLGLGTSSPQTQLDIANGLMFGTIDAFPSATYDAAAVIAKTGSLGSAPFNNAGSIVYRARVTSTAGRSSHIFYTGSPSTERMRLDESGRVGIGTTTPNQRLTVGVAQTANTVMPVLKLTTTGAYSGAGSSDAGASVEFGQYHDTYPNWVLGQISAIRSGASWDGALLFYTNNGTVETNKTERMRITSGGDILVAGTYNPYTAANRGNITLNGTSGNVIGFANGTAMRGFIYHDGTNLEIANTTSNPILFATAGTERMRITSGGELLINTTSDAGDYKLQVNGNAYLTGTTTVLLNMNNTTASTGKNWRFSSASNGNFYITHDGVVDAIQLTPTTGNATFAGSIKTAAPSGGTAKPWKLGTVATVSPTSPDRTIEVEIDGVTYYIHAKTTNN